MLQLIKQEFSFSCNQPGVLDLTECHLVSRWCISLLNSVRTWWESSGLEPYRMNDTGALRTLTVREAMHTSDKLVMLTVSGNPAYALKKHQIESFIKAVSASVPEEGRLSIFLRVQQIHKDAPTQFFEMHLHGPDHLLEKIHLEGIEPLSFKISPTSFFRPTDQAEKLYARALGMISFPKSHVLALYAGTAALAIAIAQRANKVTAIEINPYACFDARVNCELNGTSNLEIMCADVGKKLEALNLKTAVEARKKVQDFELQTPACAGDIPQVVKDPAQASVCSSKGCALFPHSTAVFRLKDAFDLVVMEPPRTGLDAKALLHLKALRPKEILYISCNPQSQVENVRELVLAGYRLIHSQPVDPFPHTPHIENITLLRLV